jgi:hypothetical protein
MPNIIRAVPIAPRAMVMPMIIAFSDQTMWAVQKNYSAAIWARSLKPMQRLCQNSEKIAI